MGARVSGELAKDRAGRREDPQAALGVLADPEQDTPGHLRSQTAVAEVAGAPWQRFHLRLLPQGQGSLRPRRESCAA